MKQLSGVFAATVTPFDQESGAVDHGWILRHLDYLRAHGCDGVVPLGTNGEGPALSLAERKAVIETVLDHADGLGVIPGTGCANLPETSELTRFALNAGADGVLVIPAFYFKNVSAAGVLNYYRRLCDAAVQPGQRLFLYHFPAMSAVPIALSVVEGLLESHPDCVAGIKDSSGVLNSITGWGERFPGFQVFAGSDTLATDAYRAGLVGTITAAANIVPHLVQAVRQAVLAGQDASEAQRRLNVVRGWQGRFPMRAATKFLVEQYAGLPPTAVRPPLVELSAEQRAELARLAGDFDIF